MYYYIMPVVTLVCVLTLLLMLEEFTKRWVRRRQYKKFYWELLDIQDVLNAALDSSEADRKLKIKYSVNELRKLV